MYKKANTLGPRNVLVWLLSFSFIISLSNINKKRKMQIIVSSSNKIKDFEKASNLQ